MKQLLIVLFLLSGVYSNAQTPKELVLAFDTTYENKSVPVPFRGVKFVDARFDRSKIGCGHTRLGKLFSKFQKNNIVFPDSLQSYLPYLFNSLFVYNSTSDDSLIVMIKKFRLAEMLSSNTKGAFHSDIYLTISASFYTLQKGMLKKLHSIDDVWLLKELSEDKEGPSFYEEGVVAKMLRSTFYTMIKSTNWNAVPQQTSFTFKDMEVALQKRFDLPLYKQTPPVGLYKNLSEFKNASPSVKDITIVYGKNTIDKVLLTNSNTLNLEDYWGLYDGKKYYYFFRGEMAEMKPSDRSFQVSSFRTKAELRGKTTGTEVTQGLFLKGVGDSNKVEEYFDLDMDSGELFLEEIFGKSGLKSMQRELLR